MNSLKEFSRGPRIQSSRYLPHSNKRQAQRLARQLATGQLRFFDHDANRARIFDAATERQIDRYREAMGEPTPELAIADYDDGPVSIQAEIPHPETPIPPDGVKAVDLAAMCSWVAEDDGKAFPAGAARDRLRNAGLIEYVGKRWVVTKSGRAILDRR